jgi:Plasmid stabilization system protein
MVKYHFTNKAVDDLSDIWNYTYDVWSEKQADLYYEMLINICKELAENPNLGKNYEKITKKLYGYRISKHVIFYRIISTEEIEIVRILHGNMDLKSRIHE